MQDKYISLDPSIAESQAKVQRSELWQQRVFEARGGQVGFNTGVTLGVTATAMAAAYYKKRGLALTPFSASKIPHLVGIAFWGVVGFSFGRSVAEIELGDTK